jgi:hypothetical protein
MKSDRSEALSPDSIFIANPSALVHTPMFRPASHLKGAQAVCQLAGTRAPFAWYYKDHVRLSCKKPDLAWCTGRVHFTTPAGPTPPGPGSGPAIGQAPGRVPCRFAAVADQDAPGMRGPTATRRGGAPG